MNIEDLIADLSEADRKNRVTCYADPQTNPSFAGTNLDFSSPIYYFKDLYDSNSHLYKKWDMKTRTAKWRSEGLMLIKNDYFFIPNKKCLIIWESHEQLNITTKTRIIHVVHCKQKMNDTILHSFDYIEKTNKWLYWPVRIQLNRKSLTSDPYSLVHHYKPLTSSSSIRSAFAQGIANNMIVITASTMLLAAPAGIVKTTWAESNRTKLVNTGRIKNGKSKIGLVIEIEVQKVRYTQNPATKGTGSPKRPHNRAGTYYTVRRSKGSRVYTLRIHRIWSVIHGGSKTTPPHIVLR